MFPLLLCTPERGWITNAWICLVSSLHNFWMYQTLTADSRPVNLFLGGSVYLWRDGEKTPPLSEQIWSYPPFLLFLLLSLFYAQLSSWRQIACVLKAHHALMDKNCTERSRKLQQKQLMSEKQMCIVMLGIFYSGLLKRSVCLCLSRNNLSWDFLSERKNIYVLPKKIIAFSC